MIRRTPLKVKEADAQRAILEWLTAKRIFHYRNNTGAMKGEYKGKTWFMRFGTVGSPDIVAIVGGRYVGIEVKGTGGKQSEHQIEFQRSLEQAGGFYILATTIDQVERQIKNIFEPDTLEHTG